MTQNILTVGAGPVGLTLVIELARGGRPLRTVEKAERTDKSRPWYPGAEPSNC